MDHALWGSALGTVLLVGVHAAVPELRRRGLLGGRAFESFGGGFAVAFVFMEIFPGLLEHREVLGEAVSATPLTIVQEMGVFSLALAGFSTFYALERWAQRTRDEGTRARVYRVHLASYSAYNALIALTLPARMEAGPAFAALFALAMGLHFALTDRGLEVHFAERFERRGRILLALALAAGWIVGVTVSDRARVAVALASSLLAGAILLNVFKEELPEEREAVLPAFLAGAALSAGLLLGVAALE